jgi:GAF domain-containing protein/FixJ family two-component response regulator
MGGERILIIDDKVEIVTFLTDLLQPLNYQVSSVTNGRDGLTKALAEQPDLILLDLNMPGMSGIDVLEALHRQDFQSPVILMTLYGSEKVVVRALRLGVRDYISKPFDINELLVSVDWALAEGRLKRERERLVVELRAANQKLVQRMRDLVTLQAVGRSVASLMPRDEVLRRILDAALHLSGADASTIFLLDRDGVLRLEAIRHGRDYQSGLKIDVGDSHAQDALLSGAPLWVSAPPRRTGVTSYLGQKARSLLYVPVRLGEQGIAVLGVVHLLRDLGHSNEVQGRLLALADYAAIALTNARFYEGLQQETQQLNAVNRIGQVVISSLDLSEIMQVVVHEVRESLHAETASLILKEEPGQDLAFKLVLGNGEPRPGSFRLEAGQGIVGWVMENGQPVRVDDVSQDPRFWPGIDEITGSHSRSLLCVPLAVSDQIIGAIEVVNKLDDQKPGGCGCFSEGDEALLYGAAAFVAMAVENARLHAAVRDVAAAETLQETVVTLSHYVNNPLQTLFGAAELLKRDLVQAGDQLGQVGESMGETVPLIERKIREIGAVLSILSEITRPESTVYVDSVHMLDIEKELRARMAQAGNSGFPPPRE